MPKIPRWRQLLDPRDPDYIEPECDCAADDDREPDSDLTDRELDAAASEAENRWRNEP